MKFDKLYDQLINEMKIISSPFHSYKINNDIMEPVVYRDTCICFSSLNKNLDHVVQRIYERTDGRYNIDTILKIVKRYIDKDSSFKKLFTQKNRNIYSCSIQSKEFNLIKVQVTFEKNNARDIFSSGVENCKYFCFIYTILSKDMKEHNDDIKLLVESSDVFVD